jgi:uncharacterized protein (TIGR02246 family)
MKQNRITKLVLILILCAPGTHSSTASGQSSSGGDEEAIRSVISGTTDAFNKHDAKAYARFYAEDAEFINVQGEKIKGAAEIEKRLSTLFATRAKAAVLKTLHITVRFIRSDVAIAHVTGDMSGITGVEGDKVPPHRELSIRILVKENGIWRVTAFHNTRTAYLHAPVH